jgi:regulator of nonsense transcripts 2
LTEKPKIINEFLSAQKKQRLVKKNNNKAMTDNDVSKTQFLKQSDTDGLDTINISQNEAATKANEIASLKNYIDERAQRLKAKLVLREKNLNAPESLRLDENFLKKLDSSIKKVTSFIKRLKSLTESQKDALSKEMLQLNLSKYLSEVAAAFIEAKLKMNDIPCALHLCSLMHQNYAEFSPLLFEQWQKLLNLKKDEKVANPSKFRVDLRFFAELITIGIMPQKESLSLLGNQLTILTLHDKEHANISIITSFCKHCGEDFEDLVPLKYENLALKHDIKIPPNTIYSSERQKAVKALFRDYYRTLVQHLLNEHKEIQRLERQNNKIYQVILAHITRTESAIIVH